MVRATLRQSTSRPDKIALRVGRVVNTRKVTKHFRLKIADELHYSRDEEASPPRPPSTGSPACARASPGRHGCRGGGALLQGPLGRRTGLPQRQDRDLHVRPIYRVLSERVRAHIFLCMLAYYVEWHLRRRLAPLLFDEEDPAGPRPSDAPSSLRPRSRPAPKKKHRASSTDALPVHSFQTLLKALSRVIKTRLRIRLPQDSEPFDKLSGLAPLQKRAFSLLGLRPWLPGCCTQYAPSSGAA